MLLAVRRAPKELQRQIRKQTKTIGQPEWQSAMAQEHQLASRVTQLVLVKTARMSVSNQNIRLSSASVGKALSGGLKPSVSYAGFEFGADQNGRTSYKAHSRTGTEYWVRNRHTRRQLPRRNPNGFVFYPAVARMIPRIAALWAQTAVRVLMEAFEAKNA